MGGDVGQEIRRGFIYDDVAGRGPWRRLLDAFLKENHDVASGLDRAQRHDERRRAEIDIRVAQEACEVEIRVAAGEHSKLNRPLHPTRIFTLHQFGIERISRWSRSNPFAASTSRMLVSTTAGDPADSMLPLAFKIFVVPMGLLMKPLRMMLG